MLDEDWSRRRGHAIAQHAAAQQRQREAETARARALVTRFAEQARARGLADTALRAHGYDGRSRYRTRLRGWYLVPDRSLAVGTDGEFYVLSVPGGFVDHFRRVDVAPEDPRLIVGEGARDGESIPLDALLTKRLDAGDRWP